MPAAVLSVVLVPRKETCEMAAEKNFSLTRNPNLLAWLYMVALKRTQGCPYDSKQNSFCVHVWQGQRPSFKAKGKE